MSFFKFSTPAQDPDVKFVKSELPKVDGWLLEGAALLTLALLRAQDDKGIRGSAFEIGVFRGKYLAALYHGTKRAGDAVVGIDVFEWTKPEEVTTNLKKVFAEQDRLDLITVDSRKFSRDQYLAAAKGSAPRFVSVDGDHTSPAVRADLEFSMSLLGDRGIIAIDDFLNPRAIGVSQGAYEFLLSEGGSKVKPFAFCQNKMFVCRESDHPVYLEQAWHFAENCPDPAIKDEFAALAKNGRNWVEQDLLGVKCLII
jgi:Methyltransferase domain